MALNSQILEKIRVVEPYVPGEQPKEKVIKLNTNENPYPPAPGVQRVLQEIDSGSFRLYPDPTSDLLITELAKTYGVGKDQVSVGVGSDDVISMSFLTFFHSEKSLLYSNSTSRLPAWILFTAVLAVSVNHANVEPTSIETQSTIESTLRSNARLVVLLFVIVFLPPYSKFLNDNM